LSAVELLKSVTVGLRLSTDVTLRLAVSGTRSAIASLRDRLLGEIEETRQGVASDSDPGQALGILSRIKVRVEGPRLTADVSLTVQEVAALLEESGAAGGGGSDTDDAPHTSP
jgi:hypothetical protein